MLRKNKTHDFVANKFFEIENFRIFFVMKSTMVSVREGHGLMKL